MKKIILFSTLFCAISFVHATTTYVPDDNFENYLETHDALGNIVSLGASTSMGNGIANDDLVTTSQINSVLYLDIRNISVNNLIGLNDFTALSELRCGGNGLNSLDVSALSNLVKLDCSYNNLTSLNISTNSRMTELLCNDNQLTSLDVSTNGLTGLVCSNNKLVSLYLSGSFGFQIIDCSSNKLTSLSVKTGQNTTISSFDAMNNPSLNCIEVDDAAWSTTNWTNKDAHCIYSTNCGSALTYVPDNNFENYLETHDLNGNTVAVGAATSMGNGRANDDYVITSRINTVLDLRISGQNISDLTGLEDFIALEYLFCVGNSLSSLDVSGLLNLDQLYCYGNQIGSLDLSQNLNLIEAYIYSNNITTLNLGNNTNLEEIAAADNVLTSIDLTGLPNLKLVDFSNNAITELDVSQNLGIKKLHFKNTQIEQIDLRNNNLLIEVLCNDNSQLQRVNINNGNNTILATGDSKNCPLLSCIVVDDVTYSNLNWSAYKDLATSYVGPFSLCYRWTLSIKDAIAKEVKIYPNPSHGKFKVDVKSNTLYTIYNLQGQLLKTGELNSVENTLNLSDLSNGVYLLIAFVDGRPLVQKLYKE